MKRRIFFDLALILILGLIPLLWFSDGTIILGHDAGLTLNPVANFVDRLYVWTQRFGIGTDQSFALLGAFLIHGLEAFLAWIGFSLPVQQKIQFVLWFVLPGLAMYFLVYKLWPERRYLPVIAATVYMINYYLVQAWFIAERTKFSIYAGFPIFLYFLLSYFLGRISFLPSVIFAGLTISILNGGGSFPLYGGLIITVLTIYVYFALLHFEKKTFLKIVYFSSGVALVYLLLNAYWLIPYAFYILGFYGRDLALAGGPEGALGWAGYISQGATFFNLLRGQGIPDWYLNQYHAFAQNFFTNPLFISLSFAYPILAYLSLFFVKEKKTKLLIYLFVILSLVALIFTSGPRSQIGIIYNTLALYLPGFAIFRSVYYKFGYAFWFAYAILIGFSLDHIFSRIQARLPKNLATFFQRVAIITVAGFIVFYHYPILNGSFFDYSREPSKELTTRIKVPKYVLEFGKWINQKNADTRYLIVPELSESGYVAYKWKYWSVAPLNSLLSRHSFVQNSLLLPISERVFISKMYQNFLREDFESFLDFAEVFAINGIVLQKDFDWKNISWGTTNPAIYEEILNKNPNFRLEKTFGEWEVYSIVGRQKPPRVNATTRLSFLQGDLKNIVSFPYFDPRAAIFMGELDRKNSPYFVLKAGEIFVTPECFNCDLKGPGLGLTFYDPKVLPGSFFYPLIRIQEQDIKRKSNDFKSLLNYHLTISDRRIIEAKSIVDRELNLVRLRETLDRHRKSLADLKRIVGLKEWKITGKEENTSAEITRAHLLQQATWIEELYINPLVKTDSKKILADSYERVLVLESLARNKVWITKDPYNKRFIFDLPKIGEYGVYVKKGGLAHPDGFEKSVISLAEKPDLKIAPKGEVEGWLSYGLLKIDNNRLRLSLIDSTVRNLLEGIRPNLPLDSKGMKEESGTYSFTTDSIDKCLSFNISNLETIGARYMISFQYRNLTDRKDLSFYLTFPGQKFPKLDILGTFLPNSRKLSTEERFVDPKDKRVKIFFCNGFATLSERISGEEVSPSLIPGQTLIEIKDIKLVKVSSPILMLYKKQRELEGIDYVQNFGKESPVSYTAEIKENKGPLLLTIRESYGKYWQVCEDRGKCYPFDEQIHFASAEYGNAWYFENGIQGKLKIYYLPQQMFIIGLFISIFSLVIILGVVCWDVLRKKHFS